MGDFGPLETKATPFFCKLVEDEPLGPVVVGDLARGVDPSRPEPLDQSRVPDSDHKQVGK